MKRVLLLGILFASIAVFSQSKGDQYWNGNSGSSDNISQGSNWWSGSNPNSGDNLYFNNTSNRHWVYSDYGEGSWFDKVITYDGAGGIKFYGDNIYANKYENNSDPFQFELSPNSSSEGNREIGNRAGNNLEINPVGSGGILISCDKLSIDNNSTGPFDLNIYGNNALTIEADIYEKNGTGSGLSILNSATVILKGNNSYTGATTINGGVLELQGDVSGSDITVKDGAKLIINGSDIIVKSITVEASGTVEVLAGKSLTVAGDLSNSGTFTLKSDQTGKPVGNPTGSLIVNGAITGDISVERYIAGHGDVADAGWHLLSTPMTSTTILGSDFFPGENDDFYRYHEASDMWINRKNSAFDMSAGIGYLCSYETGATKTFTGLLNNGDVNVSSLTISGDGSNTEAGWNLVGNPYASAIIWSPLWGTNIDFIAKTYPGSGTYIDIDPGDYIPSMQGFFIKVSAETSMLIPKLARFHSSNAWSKEVQSDIESLNLKVSGGTNSFYDISRVRFAESATENFDSEFDSHKMYGQVTAPQLLTRIGEEVFSTNTFADSQESRTVNLDFIPGTDGEYTIEFIENTIPQKGTITLEDLVTNQVIDVYSNESYTFTAEVGDEQARFKLHFGATGLNELAKENLQAYISGQNLYILGESGQAQLEVFDIQGKQLVSEQIELDENYKKALSLPSGIYVVRVQNNTFVKSNKVIIK